MNSYSPIEVYRYIIKHQSHFIIDGKFCILYWQDSIDISAEVITFNSIQLKQGLIAIANSQYFSGFIIRLKMHQLKLTKATLQRNKRRKHLTELSYYRETIFNP